MSLSKLVVILSITSLSIALQGCADRHFLQLSRKITNDAKFNKVETVVVDLEFDEIDYTERSVSLHSSRVIHKGTLAQNKKIIIDALSESLSFDGKSVFSLEEYQRIKKDLMKIRPAAGHKDPKLGALIRLKISYNIQTGKYEKERVYRFYRKEYTCRYLKNPPKKYKPCQDATNSAWDEIRLDRNAVWGEIRLDRNAVWDEIRLDRNAVGLVDLWYSGDVYLNSNNEYVYHRSINGSQLITTRYQDEKILNQSIAAGLGTLISNNIGY